MERRRNITSACTRTVKSVTCFAIAKQPPLFAAGDAGVRAHNMTPAQEIATFATDHLTSVLGESGYVLYSDAKSLQPCPVYLLGHNLGGSPKDQADATVRASLEELPGKTLNNYLDEAWTTASQRSWSKGQAPLQRWVVWLLQQLGLSPRSVPCSNLIFVRSIGVSGSSFRELSDLCWVVHEQIIDIVVPTLLLVFGNSDPSPYSYLSERLGSTNESSCESGHGNWLCRSFGSRDYTVVGLPHLSRYNVIGKHDVVRWIKKQSARLRRRTDLRPVADAGR